IANPSPWILSDAILQGLPGRDGFRTRQRREAARQQLLHPSELGGRRRGLMVGEQPAVREKQRLLAGPCIDRLVAQQYRDAALGLVRMDILTRDIPVETQLEVSTLSGG